MKLNTLEKRAPVFTHEGAKASHISPEQELRRSVMACLLWENTFYEEGTAIADRITTLVGKVKPDKVATMALEAREKMKLRHVPLLLVRELARKNKGQLVSETIARVIQRADELSEFLAVYWKDKKQPLSASVKKGLAKAFQKFDAYALAKYNRDSKIKLRDVLFLCHAKPKDDEQAKLWKQLVDNTLPIPDTWEVALSTGKDKKETWERLIAEKKLGALAVLRNLRNMKEAGVPEKAVFGALESMKVERVLPFRFIAAAKYAPQWEAQIEQAMLKCLAAAEKLPGKTALVIDNSGSMHGAAISEKSEIDRADAACALAILLREVCEQPLIIGYGSDAKVIPSRRGFALRDAIKTGPGGGTYTDDAIQLAKREGYDRIIVVTDEQSHQSVSDPGTGKRGYFVNVSVHQNGIGYGPWTHIDGWSEAILNYIQQAEN